MWATEHRPQRAPRRGLAVCASALLIVRTALAQQPSITEEDLERVRRAQPQVSEQDIDAARARHAAPPPSIPIANPAPDLSALPQPLSRATPDLGALAGGYTAQAGSLEAAQALAQGPALLIFVSLALPAATLDRLLAQAARARASVILRGLAQGSLRATVGQLQPLLTKHAASVQIDPQAFDRFDIQRVPSFVLLRDGVRPAACAAGSCPPAEGFARAAGDVSLDYALTQMQHAAPALRDEAALFLARLVP